ncbi:hypothetical protein KQX54_001888 [Cotesia glomerata]|uniref:Uncharacterized protein n=1 Tax=Cotesia glomerata TaxID=32391 RepID=A0AAV7I4B2_COTGL|nr:hypothetical protein KQX54_001888 [Cotesia glomerata]
MILVLVLVLMEHKILMKTGYVYGMMHISCGRINTVSWSEYCWVRDTALSRTSQAASTSISSRLPSSTIERENRNRTEQNIKYNTTSIFYNDHDDDDDDDEALSWRHSSILLSWIYIKSIIDEKKKEEKRILDRV